MYYNIYIATVVMAEYKVMIIWIIATSHHLAYACSESAVVALGQVVWCAWGLH